MSGQREATEAARERLRELRRLLPKTTYTSTDERTIAVGALAFLVDGFTRVLNLLDGDYTTWDQDKKFDGIPGPNHDEPSILAWEKAHGHDIRLKCYAEFGCQLLLDPEDVRAALLGES